METDLEQFKSFETEKNVLEDNGTKEENEIFNKQLSVNWIKFSKQEGSGRQRKKGRNTFLKNT